MNELERIRRDLAGQDLDLRAVVRLALRSPGVAFEGAWAHVSALRTRRDCLGGGPEAFGGGTDSLSYSAAEARGVALLRSRANTVYLVQFMMYFVSGNATLARSASDGTDFGSAPRGNSDYGFH